MKKPIYRFLPGLLLLVAVWAMSACTERIETPSAGDGYLDLEFLQAETRAVISPDGSGSFSDGDRVGLFIDNGSVVQYRELTYQGGVWTPRLKRSEFGTGRLTLSAHYPVQTGSPQSAGQYTYALPTDQSNETTLSSADILFARVELPEGSYRAQLPFEHLFHRLQVELSPAGNGASVSVRSISSGTLNLLTGEVTVTGAQYRWITPYTQSDGSFMALVLPQSAEPYRSGEGLLKIVNGDKSVAFMAPSQTTEGNSLTTFASGMQTTLRLTITESGTVEPDPDPSEPTNPDVANQTLWTYGVHAPAFPGKENIPTYAPGVMQAPAGAWFRWNYTHSEIQQLTWAEGCGWYDCNKSAEYNENDANLCWAASASNMIIWWMVNNRPYIEAYTQKYGSTVTSTVTPDRIFERPSDEFKPLYPEGVIGSNYPVNRAPVFEFFKSSFRDNGNWDVGGVNWFITGYQPPQMVSPKIQGFPGFFSEVFQKNDVIAKESARMPNAQMFNDFILDALQHRKGLGFSVYDIAGQNTGNHSMVIWGVEFDENGLASHLYYCDNNWADQDMNGACISRCKVVYAKDPDMYNSEYTYMQALDNEEGNVKKKYKITALYSVDLRRDIWAKAFPDVKVED